MGFEITGLARPPQGPPESPWDGRAHFEHWTRSGVGVEIVMLEKLNYVLSKRAITPSIRYTRRCSSCKIITKPSDWRGNTFPFKLFQAHKFMVSITIAATVLVPSFI